MNITIYTETALPKTGGQEMVVDSLAREYLELGHKVTILAPRPRWRIKVDDTIYPYRVVRHPRFYSTRYFVPWYRRYVHKLYRQEKFDLLHCMGLYPTGYLAGLLKDQLPIPLVITSHGGDVYEKNVRIRKPVLRERHCYGLAQADCLLAISQFTRAGLLRLCPHPRRLENMPNGVDLRPFRIPAPRPADLDPAIRSGTYAFFIGRHKYRKGIDVLLQALALVPANGSVQLVIAGDGEERQNLEALTAQLGLSERVRFVGQRTGSQKIYLLQNALCSVVPSRMWEAFGIVAIEGYAAGLPVIASRLPGLQDLIEDNQSGMLVPEENPQALANALQHLLSDPQRARRLGWRASQLAEKYSWRTIAEQHLLLYRDLIQRKNFRKAA